MDEPTVAVQSSDAVPQPDCVTLTELLELQLAIQHEQNANLMEENAKLLAELARRDKEAVGARIQARYGNGNPIKVDATTGHIKR